MDFLEAEKTIEKADKTKYFNLIHWLMVEKIPMSLLNCKTKNIRMILHFVTIPLVGVFYTIAWFVLFIIVSAQLLTCQKNTNFTCRGEILMTCFGFFNFVTWNIIFFVALQTWRRMYLMYKYGTYSEMYPEI